MDNRAKFYCWLIGKLERRHMTIQEICNDWVESSSNIDGKVPTRRYQSGCSVPCAWHRSATC